ncbi:MAG: ankyrin repeat domain-containing protein [Pirellulales bacterium]|nr:ankyrin repeat domain-containing protein [Pirellulales bacterium]
MDDLTSGGRILAPGELCQAGKLFEVQQWIEAGKPVNPPARAKKSRQRTPLDTAIDYGFHSLVATLLEAGAHIESASGKSSLNRALERREFEIVRLLVDHGADPSSGDMRTAFDARDAEILAYLIDRRADVETGNPLAYALCHRIRSALRVIKDYRASQMSFQAQTSRFVFIVWRET